MKQFDHEKLDVYKLALKFATWSYELSKGLSGIDRYARDQLLRASQSIPLNIAEGNGKRPGPDRRRFFEVARGSALECAAILDILSCCEVIDSPINEFGKDLLYRIVSMLTRLADLFSEVNEGLEPYEAVEYENE
jgi:four helix bundle protein